MPEGHAEVVLYWASVRRAKRAQRLPSSLGFPDQAGGLQESSHLATVRGQGKVRGTDAADAIANLLRPAVLADDA